MLQCKDNKTLTEKVDLFYWPIIQGKYITDFVVYVYLVPAFQFLRHTISYVSKSYKIMCRVWPICLISVLWLHSGTLETLYN